MENRGKSQRSKSLSEIDEKADLYAAVFVGCLIVLTLLLLLTGCEPIRVKQNSRGNVEDSRAWSSPVFQNGNQLSDMRGNRAWLSNGGRSTTQGGTVTTLPNEQRFWQDNNGRVHTLPR